jgi:glycosyltransferase involved in cell wall biosynthesis
MDKTKPLIFSLVTPTWNQGPFIAKTIESILSQEGNFYIDYIIMDGGSTDQTVEEIKKYEKILQDNCTTIERDGLTYYVAKDKNFEWNRCLGISYRWWSKKDNGQSDAINQGIKLSKGDISAWINSDDGYYEGILQKIADVFANNDIDVVVGHTIAIDAEGKELWRQTPDLPSLYSLLYLNVTPQQPAIFYTLDLINKVNGVDESLHYVMDVDLWTRFCFAGARFYKLYEYVAYQIYHDASKSTQGDTMFEKFKPEDKKIKTQYRARLPLLQRLKYTFRTLLRGIIPRPVKDLLNKIVG